MKAKLNIFTSHWFLIGLSLLLLNDFVLKDLYGNWFTGKLSDFSGVFIFFLFWSAIFPKLAKQILVFVTLFFVFWKSTYSQVIIDEWNALNIMSISRVVDYTDLFALLVLPLAFRISKSEHEVNRIKISPAYPLILASFAFVATSKEPQTCFDENSAVYFIQHSSRDSLITDLKNSELNITVSKPQSKSEYVFAKVPNLKDSIFDLELLIGEFDQDKGVVPVNIRCWHYSTDYDNKSNNVNSEKHEYVKRVFEKDILEPIFQQK